MSENTGLKTEQNVDYVHRNQEERITALEEGGVGESFNRLELDYEGSSNTDLVLNGDFPADLSLYNSVKIIAYGDSDNIVSGYDLSLVYGINAPPVSQEGGNTITPSASPVGPYYAEFNLDLTAVKTLNQAFPLNYFVINTGGIDSGSLIGLRVIFDSRKIGNF